MSLLLKNLRIVPGVVNNLMKNGSYITRGLIEIKSDLKIKWTRPVKVPSVDPEKSGDGGIDHDVKSDELANRYDVSEELKTADDIVKKLFTLDYLPRGYTEEKNRDKTLAMVQRHQADRGSMESRIAAMTSEILHLQRYMKEHRRNNRTKHFLKELIDQRRRFLGLLRKWDYRRFEWVLEKMNLVFRPHPQVYTRVERKASLRKLTTKHCDKIRQDRLDAYKAELEEQKKIFFKEKAEKLAFIRSEEIYCGLTPTVTEEEIEAARKRAAEFQ